jgi:uncharacterized protein (TIGR04255 family)
MPVKVPKASLEHLESAPVKVALVQVRYSPLHAVAKRDLVADFESRLPDDYVAQPAQVGHAITVQIGSGPPAPPLPVAGPAIPATDVDTVWPFRDETRGYVVSLGNSSLAVQVDSSYHDFPSFLQQFRAAVMACTEIFQPKREIRLGLRYVNAIEDRRLRRDVRTIVNPELVSPVGTGIQGGLLGSFAELRVRENLGTFAVRHGLVEDASTYLLDFDYFSEKERDFNGDRVIKSVEGFHELIERVFVWSLNPDYLAELKSR